MARDIAESIAVALEGRRAQRGQADGLLQAWGKLTDSVESLEGALTEARAQFSRDRANPGRGGIAEGLGRWLRDADFQALPAKVREQQDGVARLHDRAYRDTVNIAVVGQSGSGKSTFLRTITRVPDAVIPLANVERPTTAARSRIVHSRDRREAVVTLRTWKEFRDGYLGPLHRLAQCPGEVPATAQGFLAYGYADRQATSSQRQAPGEGVTSQEVLDRLILAQDSFGSYEPLLGQPQRTEPLERLRPYVAYPEDPGDRHRPYHAVKDVVVYHPFLVNIEKLAVVDLPGAGEVGLDIESQFLADIKYDVDLLLHLFRPVRNHARVSTADAQMVDTAIRAKMGRDWKDFIYLVVNEDYDNNKDPALVIERMREDLKRLTRRDGFPELSGDASRAASARDKILLPALRQLAGRLAEMDKAVARHVGAEAGRAAASAAKVVARLADDISEWQVNVPPEKQVLADRSTRLRDQVAVSLKDKSDEYARRVQAEERLGEVDESITAAVGRLRVWAADNFGATGASEWRTRMSEKFAGAPGRGVDDACTEVRLQLRREFGLVDASLATARRALHAEIAGELRRHLGDSLVPTGDDGLAGLLSAIRAQQLQGRVLHKLRTALEDLLAFRTGYGNIFLRVGRPIVAQIRWEAIVAARLAGPPVPDAPTVRRARPLLPDSSLGFDVRRSRLAAGASVAGAAQPHAALTVAAFATALTAAARAGEVIAPMIRQWLWTGADENFDSVESFRARLSVAFDRAVDLIAHQLRDEAARLIEALAAIVDEFYDGFTRVPGIEVEYEDLTYDFRHELWPGAFSDGTDDLIAGLRALRGAVGDAQAAAGAATDAAARLVAQR